jgi:hypothetical protein
MKSLEHYLMSDVMFYAVPFWLVAPGSHTRTQNRDEWY